MSGDYVDEYQFITLSDDRRKKLLEAIEAGATVQLACEFIGVNPIAYLVWRRGAEVYFKKTANGLQPDDFETHAHALYNEIEEARFKVFQEIMPCIKAAMIKDWKAAAYLRDKLYPERAVSEELQQEKKSPVFSIYDQPAREDMDDW